MILASQELDPDVFVWDSAQRLIRYSQGQYNVQTVLRHTLLIKPGTAAAVISCRKGVVLKYLNAQADIIGIRVLAGPGRGHYGWITSADARRTNGTPVTKPDR